MSMSCYVLGKRHLADTDEWQRQLQSAGFKLQFNPGRNRTIGELSGHLPATWQEREAGFECDAEDAEAAAAYIAETFENLELGGPWPAVLDIYYWGYAGMAGAMMAAAVYAKATDGVVLEAEGGVLWDADTAIDEARKCEDLALKAFAAGEE